MKCIMKILLFSILYCTVSGCASIQTLDAPYPIQIEDSMVIVGETKMKALQSCSYVSHLDFDKILLENSYYTGIMLYDKQQHVLGELGVYVDKQQPLKEAIIASIRIYHQDANITYAHTSIPNLTYTQAKTLFPDAIFDQYSVYMHTGAYALQLHFTDDQTLQSFQHQKEYPVEWHQ